MITIPALRCATDTGVGHGQVGKYVANGGLCLKQLLIIYHERQLRSKSKFCQLGNRQAMICYTRLMI